MIIRYKPLTLFTSTKIERILYSKEKRTFIKAVDLFFQACALTIGFIYFVTIFLSVHNTDFFKIVLYIMLILILIFTIFVIYKAFKPGLNTYFGSMSKKKKGFFTLAITVYLFLLLFLFPVYLGSSIPSNDEQLKLANDYYIAHPIMIWITLLPIFIVGCLYVWLLGQAQKFINVYIFKVIETNLYIKHEIEGSVSDWYLFHPTENNQILIGDHSNIYKCMSHCFIETSELLKKKIYKTKDLEHVNDSQ